LGEVEVYYTYYGGGNSRQISTPKKNKVVVRENPDKFSNP